MLQTKTEDCIHCSFQQDSSDNGETLVSKDFPIFLYRCQKSIYNFVKKTESVHHNCNMLHEKLYNKRLFMTTTFAKHWLTKIKNI